MDKAVIIRLHKDKISIKRDLDKRIQYLQKVYNILGRYIQTIKLAETRR